MPALPIPPVNAPLVGPDGKPTSVWQKWFQIAHDRLGGSVGAVPAEHGGTGATSLARARRKLGIAGSPYDLGAAPAGKDVNDSGNVVSTHLASPLPVAQGGTGGTDAATAKTSLEIPTGTIAVVTSGTIGARPTVTTVGYMYFDTTLGKPIWWGGAAWKDATGAAV